MPDRIFVYVDGESHYHRSDDAWRKLRGDEASLGRLRYRDQPDERLVLVDSKAKVFWTKRMTPGAWRTFYFTSAPGDDSALHKIRVALRLFDLEPVVLQERNELAKRRQNALETLRLIEKPKGVDISLAVRMLEQAYSEAFDVCHLYTSDIDFLPVIQAVRSRGKKVMVHGYADGLGERSPFFHECDQFTDLTIVLHDQCELAPE